eukprot:8436124-Lingulodinium_polyedra.AAC.1
MRWGRTNCFSRTPANEPRKTSATGWRGAKSAVRTATSRTAGTKREPTTKNSIRDAPTDARN